MIKKAKKPAYNSVFGEKSWISCGFAVSSQPADGYSRLCQKSQSIYFLQLSLSAILENAAMSTQTLRSPQSLRVFWRTLPFAAGGMLVAGLLWLGNVADRPVMDSSRHTQSAALSAIAMEGVPAQPASTAALFLKVPSGQTAPAGSVQNYDRIQTASIAASAQAAEPGDDSGQQMSPAEEQAYYGEDSNAAAH